MRNVSLAAALLAIALAGCTGALEDADITAGTEFGISAADDGETVVDASRALTTVPGTYQVQLYLVSGGGGAFSKDLGSRWSLGGSIAAASSGELTSANYSVVGGFWLPDLAGAPATGRGSAPERPTAVPIGGN